MDKTGVVKLQASRFFWDYFSVFISQALAFLMNLLALVLIARILNPAGYGRLALFLTVANFSTAIFLNWPNASIVKFGKAEFINTNSLSEIFLARIFIYLAMFLLSSLAVFVARDFITGYTGTGGNTVYLLLFFILTSSLIDMAGYFLQAASNIKSFGLTYIISQAATLIILLFFFYGFLKATPAMVIAVKIAAQSIVIIFCAVKMRKHIFFLKLSGIGKKIVAILEYSWPLVILACCSFVIGWVDVIVIKKYMRIEDVGVYSLAYQGMNFVNLLMASLISLTFPFIASLEAVNRRDLVVKYIDRFLPVGVLFSNIFLCAVMFLSVILIRPVFGDSYRLSVYPFLFLAVGLGFGSIGILYSSVINTFSLLKKYVFLSIACAIFNIIADLILVPKIGIQGAAVATMFTSAIGAAICINVVNGCRDLAPPKKMRYNVFICCLPALFCLGSLFFLNSAVMDFLFIVAAFFLALLIFKKNRLFLTEDIKFLQEVRMPVMLRSVLMKFLLYMSEQ